jgi:hypothetical protein
VAGAKGSLGAALDIASRLHGAAGRALAESAKRGFVDGYHAGVLVAATITFVGVAVVLVFLPARPNHADLERQAAERTQPPVTRAVAHAVRYEKVGTR